MAFFVLCAICINMNLESKNIIFRLERGVKSASTGRCGVIMHRTGGAISCSSHIIKRPRQEPGEGIGIPLPAALRFHTPSTGIAVTDALAHRIYEVALDEHVQSACKVCVCVCMCFPLCMW